MSLILKPNSLLKAFPFVLSLDNAEGAFDLWKVNENDYSTLFPFVLNISTTSVTCTKGKVDITL